MDPCRRYGRTLAPTGLSAATHRALDRRRSPTAGRDCARHRCDLRHCGSNMPRIDRDRDLAIVPMGALDDDPGIWQLTKAGIHCDVIAPSLVPNQGAAQVTVTCPPSTLHAQPTEPTQLQSEHPPAKLHIAELPLPAGPPIVIQHICSVVHLLSAHANVSPE